MALKDLLKRTMTTVSVDEEAVDPIIEQRRKEKFSTPMIYGDELEESIEKVEKAIKKSTPASTTAPVTSTASTPVRKPAPSRPLRPKFDSGYQMSEVISPIYGRKEEPNTSKDKTVAQPKKKITQKPIEDQVVPVISPIYGTRKVVEEEKVAEIAPKKTTRRAQVKKEPETVTEDLRNIASIIQEEENQLKLVEKRTGEFQFDFSKMKSEEPSLIDEIDDAMTLDELMSLYEKKFREEDE